MLTLSKVSVLQHLTAGYFATNLYRCRSDCAGGGGEWCRFLELLAPTSLHGGTVLMSSLLFQMYDRLGDMLSFCSHLVYADMFQGQVSTVMLILKTFRKLGSPSRTPGIGCSLPAALDRIHINEKTHVLHVVLQNCRLVKGAELLGGKLHCSLPRFDIL